MFSHINPNYVTLRNNLGENYNLRNNLWPHHCQAYL